MKKIIFVPLFAAMFVVFLTQCANNKTKAPIQKAAVTAGLITHKEAVDSLMADSTAEHKALIIKQLDANAALAVLKNVSLDSLFINSYPDNGFYGEDRYRIEFMFSDAKRDATDPSVYHLKGKNRHKKTITNFEGTIKIMDLKSFRDPNIDTAEWKQMGYKNLYAAKGVFELKEDVLLKTSGLFKGTIQMEFVERLADKPDLWFYSVGMYATDGRGTAGYRFDGTWTSFAKPDLVKPVIWARDLFSFANDILKDFSMGERDVEINEKYRNLGWVDFWENEEWWNESKM